MNGEAGINLNEVQALEIEKLQAGLSKLDENLEALNNASILNKADKATVLINDLRGLVASLVYVVIATNSNLNNLKKRGFE